MGDGAIVEFRSAVRCGRLRGRPAEETAPRQREAPSDHRIVYRVGINLGDVMVEGDDLFGYGVNIAARLEALTEPGVSRSAMQCRGNSPAKRILHLKTPASGS
jgi:adenylate cyclase